LSDSDRRGWSGGDRRSKRERRQTRRRTGAERRSRKAPPPEERRSDVERRLAEQRSGADRRTEAGWEAVTMNEASEQSSEAEHALLAAAIEARGRAQAHYSHFLVGAALETADGRIIGGCNIENATYGLTLCAERVALVKALSDGHTIFRRIAVVADTESPTPPCGPCRQLLWEYCGDIDIILGNLNGPRGRMRLSALLPMPFDRRLLEKC
jgi:cytidine deaminase